MYSKSFIFLLVVSPFLCYAQSQKVDSLKKKLEISIKKDTSRFDVLFQLAYQYSGKVDSISLVYATQAYELSWDLGDSARIVRAGRINSAELRRLERLDESIPIAERVLAIAKRRKITREINFLLTSLAISHMLKAQYDKALNYNFESLVIRENDGDKRGMSVSFNNIGLIYFKLQDFKRAIEYYQKSLVIKNEMNDNYDLDRLLINMGLCYNYLGQYNASEKYVRQGLSSCQGQCKDEIVLEGEIALGVSLLESGHTDESIEHFNKSNDVARRIKNYRFQAENLVSIAKAYYKKSDFELSKKYLLEAESLAIARGYRFLLETAYKIFSDLYEKTGEYKNQSEYQSKYIKLRDSILNEKVISNLSQIRTDYQERENIKTIAEKDQVVLLQKEVITRQQRQFIFIVTITFLIFLLTGVLFYYSKRQQKTNRELSSMKAQLEVHNRELEDRILERTRDLIQSNNALRVANEELDYFIYKSSHDIRGPLMTLKGICNLAQIDLTDAASIEYFKKFDLTVDRMAVILTRLQSVIYVNASDLKPERINLASLFEDVFLMEKKNGLSNRFQLSYEVPNETFLISDARLVKLIFENLIDNAIKFASTSERTDPYVKITVKPEAENIRIGIEDNGIGIDEAVAHDLFKMFVRGSERSEIGGVGLYMARIATQKIGGTLQLRSTDNSGTVFEVIIPKDLSAAIKTKEETEQRLISSIEKLSGEQVKILPVI